MKMKGYLLTLEHEEGTIRLKTTGSSAEVAIKKTMDAEYCPMGAIKAVREFNMELWTLSTEQLLKIPPLPLKYRFEYTDKKQSIAPATFIGTHSEFYDKHPGAKIHYSGITDKSFNQ